MPFGRVRDRWLVPSVFGGADGWTNPLRQARRIAGARTHYSHDELGPPQKRGPFSLVRSGKLLFVPIDGLAGPGRFTLTSENPCTPSIVRITLHRYCRPGLSRGRFYIQTM